MPSFQHRERDDFFRLTHSSIEKGARRLPPNNSVGLGEKKKLRMRINGNSEHIKHWKNSKFGSKFATGVHFVAIRENMRL
jgi:hypothetical protein